MHHQHPDLDVLTVRDRYSALLAERTNDRLVAQTAWAQQSAFHNLIRSLGRMLVQAGEQLQRSGQLVESRP